MKKVLAALLFAVTACSPQIYPLYMDVRQPSSSGLDLGRKTFGIVYQEEADSVFTRGVASSLARALEKDYFGGEPVVVLYQIPPADTVSLNLMHSLVMDTGADVIFLVSNRLGEASPETNQVVQKATSADSAYVCPVAVPVNTTLDVYDSMGEDNVISYKGNAVLRPLVYNNGVITEDGLKTLVRRSMGPQADDVGERISARFLSNWKTESYSFYYYDSEKWYDALENFAEGKFAAAVDGWAALAVKGSSLRRACAAYDIAQAFYLMEDYEMSAKWLDVADKTENLSLSAGLRKRLKAHLEKLQK